MRIALILACLTLAGCAVTPPPMDTATAGEDMPTRAEARTALRNFITVIDRVEPVAEDVCRQAGRQANCDFTILVADGPGIPQNAFQKVDDEGRPIIAFTVPLILAARNQDELAFVLSHEAAHHIAGHLQRQQAAAVIGATILGNLASFGGDASTVQSAQQLGAALGARTYSKEFELEADALGTRITKRAGYDPLRGAQFFFRIPDPGNEFLGTHPANADRLATVQREAVR